MAKKTKVAETLESAQEVIESLKAQGQYEPATKETLQESTFLDPELSTFEVDEYCDLTEHKVEDLVKLTGSTTIGDRDAFYLLVPFGKDEDSMTLRRLFLGSLKKRVQEIDPVTHKNGNVVKSSTFDMFRNCGNQYKILEKLAGTKITVAAIKQAVNPVRDADRNLTGEYRPTTVYDWTIE